MSKREQIVQAILAGLVGTTGVGSRIFRNLQEALTRDESPALVVSYAGEDVGEQSFANGQTEKRLQVVVGVYQRGADPDALSDTVCESVHAKMMAAPTLGGLAVDISEAGTTWDFDEADQTAVMVSMRYVVWYRHSRNTL